MGQVKNESTFKVKLIEHIGNNLVVHFNDAWYQEDIDTLYVLIVASLTDFNSKEKILGADRESIRFTWRRDYQFLLNFDCYSQSCWIEGIDEQSISQIRILLSSLEVGTELNER